MQKNASVDKKTVSNNTEIWTMVKEIQRIIDSYDGKQKEDESESSIDGTQDILTICHNIIDNFQGNSNKQTVNKENGKINSKEKSYKESYQFTRIKHLASIFDSLKKQINVSEEKDIVPKIKSMTSQIEAYKKFIDFILQYPKTKTFQIKQLKIPSQQQQKIRAINVTYLDLTTRIKELQQFLDKPKGEGDKDYEGTISTLLLEPVSALLKERKEEENRKSIIKTVFTNIITANFKPIKGLDPFFTQHLNKLSSQIEKIYNTSLEILEKLKECIDKYSQSKEIKKKQTAMEILLETKTKINEICYFFDKVQNLPQIKQKYGGTQYSQGSNNYKTRLDIYIEIMRNNEKIQEESKEKIRDNERQKLLSFVSQLCKIISSKGNKFIAREIVSDNLYLLVNEIKSMKSQVDSYDSLIRQVMQKNQMIKNLQELIARSKTKYMTKQVMFETGIVSYSPLLTNKNLIQPKKPQEPIISGQCDKCNELFIENSELVAINNKLKEQNRKLEKNASVSEREIQEKFQKLALILPSSLRLSLADLSRDDIIQKISNYNKSLITKYQERQKSNMQFSVKIKNLQASISSLKELKDTLENERDSNNQKLEQFQKLRQRFTSSATLLASKDKKIQSLLENIEELQQDKEEMILQHKQELNALQLNASTYPQQIQDLKKEIQFLTDQLFFSRQNGSKISSESQQDNVDREQLINQYNQKFEYLEFLLTSKQRTIGKCQDKIKDLANQVNEMKEQNNIIAKRMQSYKKQVNSLVNQYLTDFSSYVLSLEETIKQQIESYNTLLNKNELLQTDNAQLTRQIKNNQEIMAKIVSQLNKELKRERENAQFLSSEVKMKEMELETLQMNMQLEKGQSYELTQTRLQLEITELRNNKEDLLLKFKQTQDKLQQSQAEIKNLNQQLDDKQQNFNKMLKEEQAKKSKLSQINPKKGANEAQLREILRKEITEQFQQQLINLKERFNQLYTSMLREQGCFEGIKQITPFSMLYVDRLFQGNIFQDKIHYKFRVLQHLSTLNNCIVQQTKLMYKMDPRNNSNFHSYIDNTPDMLFVVMTKTGAVIAGYYSGVYQNAVMTAPGLLISVTKNDSFTLKANNRAMVYDPYFIIFGNAEFRVRSGESSVFCNFGIMNSYYDHRNKKVGDFLCAENSRQVDIEYFEIFQIIYEA